MRAETTYPATKQELLDEIAAARAELDATVNALSDDEFSAGSTPKDWSVKDHLAHLGAWAVGIADMLHKKSRWDAMNLTFEFVENAGENGINDALYQQHKDKSPAEAKAYFNACHQRLMDAIGALDYADLMRTYSYFQPDEPGDDDGTPIIWWVVHNSYIHYRMHRGWMQTKIAQLRA